MVHQLLIKLKVLEKFRGIYAFLLVVCLTGTAFSQNLDIVSADNYFQEWEVPNSQYIHYAPGEVNEKSRSLLNRLISVQLENVSMEEALNGIAELGDIKLAYSTELEKDSWGQKISLDLEKATVLGALYAALEGADLRLVLSSNSEKAHVVVVRGGEETSESPAANGRVIMQEIVTGRVSDAQTGEFLPGVNIIIKGTNTGTSTDIDGEFEIPVPTLNDTLVFTYIGYQSQEIPIGGQTELNVELQVEILGAEELVVVGYGVRARETLTGAVSSISGERIEQAPVTNISNSLSGQIPGIVTLNQSGEPGADGAMIRIRGEHTLGDNSPLVVIDGVPNRAGGLERLNPRDIENISVLKDASAAIYGAQAANGVILVTTKRGEAGPTQFNVNINQGFNQPTRVPEMADAATYLEMLNEIAIYRGNSPPYSQERIENHRQGTDPWRYPDTDWFAETLKPVSYQTRADMSVSGGSESVQYYVSLGGLTEDGFYYNSATRYSQYNFRSNIDGRITDNIRLGFDVTGRLEDRNYPTRSAGEIFRMVMRGKPNLPAYWPNGLPGPDIEYGDNPVVVGTPESGHNNDERYFFQSNISLDIEVPRIQGLTFRGNVSYDRNFREQSVWQTPWTLYLGL